MLPYQIANRSRRLSPILCTVYRLLILLNGFIPRYHIHTSVTPCPPTHYHPRIVRSRQGRASAPVGTSKTDLGRRQQISQPTNQNLVHHIISVESCSLSIAIYTSLVYTSHLSRRQSRLSDHPPFCLIVFRRILRNERNERNPLAWYLSTNAWIADG